MRYRESVGEGAAKSLESHSYEYRVDAITVNGEPVSFTTTEVVDAAGSSEPNAIDKFIVDKKLRWSPKYISPLVSIPIERLLARRGGLPLQMIVGAMGCLHAKMVHEQIRSMFGDMLRVDWVGTGPNGRSDAENAAVIRKFCPPKNRDGSRRAEDVQLDILVHVGMAGEGLDSVFVSEVVHLNRASITNQNDQENGRASRIIPGAPRELQRAFINVDSSSPYAAWSGERVMDAFDRENGESPPEEEPDDGESECRDPSELPDEPTIIIADCELLHIDRGDPEVRGCAEALLQAGNWSMTALDDPEHEIWDRAIQLRRRELEERARGQEGRSVLYQLKASIQNAVGKVASLTARRGSTIRFERGLIGDLRERINREMKKRWGHGIDVAEEGELRERYAWLNVLSRLCSRKACHRGWREDRSRSHRGYEQHLSRPKGEWRELLGARQIFVHTHLPHDCRELLRFVEEAEAMCKPLGFDSVEILIRDGLGLDPSLVGWAVDGLRGMKPEEPIPFQRAVEIGKLADHGRQSADRTKNGRFLPEKAKADNIRSGAYGTSAAYTRARLERDALKDPVCAKALGRLQAGLMSANAAAVEAGFRKAPDPVRTAVRAVEAVPDQRMSEFVGALEPNLRHRLALLLTRRSS